jgi:hypothetical protein
VKRFAEKRIAHVHSVKSAVLKLALAATFKDQTSIRVFALLLCEKKR